MSCGCTMPRKVRNASNLSRCKLHVDDEVVLLGIVRCDAAAQPVAVNFVDVAHEPAQKIDWMAGTAQDQVLRHLDPPRGVVVDRAEIVNVVGLGHEEFADFSGIAGALRLDEVIPPAQTLRDEQYLAGSVNSFHNLFDLFHRVHHRLGNHHVLARVERGQDLLRVKRSGRVDADDIEVTPRDQLVEIGCQSVDSEFAAERFELVLPRIAQSGDANR